MGVGAAGAGSSRQIGSQVWALGCGVGLGTAAPQRHLQRAGILGAGAVPWGDSTRWAAR